MQFPDSRVLIFAKAPQPGRVKRRLWPVLSPEAAARLQACLLADLVARLAAARVAPLQLQCRPDTHHPCFEWLAGHYGLERRAQTGGDLGERMSRAAETALAECARVVLIGADCPGLDAGYLRHLLERLTPDRAAVLGPAEDGGYVALGLRTTDRRLFEGIEWGSDRVLRQTLARLDRLGWGCELMPVLWDLDRPADLERLRREYPDLARDRRLPAAMPD